MSTQRPLTPLRPFYRDNVVYTNEGRGYYVPADGLEVIEVQVLSHPALGKGRFAAQTPDRKIIADNCQFGERLFRDSYSALAAAERLVSARVASLEKDVTPLAAKLASAQAVQQQWRDQLAAQIKPVEQAG